MREKLAKIDEQREVFSGTFVRYGVKNGWKGPEETLLLRDVKRKRLKDIVVADHLWFNHTKGFQALGELVEGDRIEFTARVKPYMKGYRSEDKEWDYKLSHPSNAKLNGKRRRS